VKAAIFESKKARKDLGRAPRDVVRQYEIWARLVEEHGLVILKDFKGYHDEKLSGEWMGHRSSRLNRKWRVIYQVDRTGKLEVVEVTRVTPHDYRRKR